MRVLISGASGMVGAALRVALERQGHMVIPLVRSEPTGDTASWNPAQGTLDLTSAGKIDAVIHLAGDNISAGRWSAAKKRRILESRVLGTKLLADYFATRDQKPSVFTSASAIGFYGHRAQETVDESSRMGSGFLADVCHQWETATQSLTAASIRVVQTRLGVVLSAHGGALQKMLLPFKLGFGGAIGSGEQVMSWISLEDVVRSFTKILGRVLHRPPVVPMPAFLVHLLFGEMGQELLLASTRVPPRCLLDHGFEFHDSDVGATLQRLLAE